MRIHFIAIGGAVMHNLAIALKKKGMEVSGSDDEIFDPSRSRLEKYGLLPEEFGWFPDKIDESIDTIILGMHAKPDNPELIKAQQLGITINSFPEFVYEQSKHQTRVVIAGSHGKTTITSMVIHALESCKVDCDYLVGAQLEGFEVMVKLSEKAKVMIIEGDEYLTSPMDPRPKFHLYNPNVALISGIAWDHINVFPTFDRYTKQFQIFIDKILPGGTLVYCDEDQEVVALAKKSDSHLCKIPYQSPEYTIDENKTILNYMGERFPLHIFGHHNLLNLNGAAAVCLQLGLSRRQFYKAMESFMGSSNRLQNILDTKNITAFRDFAHAPSKVRASVNAVKEQFPNRKVIAFLELHTFSSLNKDFLPHYKNTMDAADQAIVFFNPHALRLKNLEPIEKMDVEKAFGGAVMAINSIDVFSQQVLQSIEPGCVCLFMSSGNFGGIDILNLISEKKA